MRPAIDPATIRRNQHKPLRTIGNWFAAYTTFAAAVIVFVHIFDPALNPFI